MALPHHPALAVTEDEKETVISVLDLEINAFIRDLSRRPPAMDDYGTKKFDVREHWLKGLYAAKVAVVQIRVKP